MSQIQYDPDEQWDERMFREEIEARERERANEIWAESKANREQEGELDEQ